MKLKTFHQAFSRTCTGTSGTLHSCAKSAAALRQGFTTTITLTQALTHVCTQAHQGLCARARSRQRRCVSGVLRGVPEELSALCHQGVPQEQADAIEQAPGACAGACSCKKLGVN